MTGDNFTTWSKVPTEIRLLHYQRDWKIEVLSSEMTTFPRGGFQVIEKDSSGKYQNWQEAFKKIYFSEEQRKNAQLQVFQIKCSKKREGRDL